MHQRGSEFSRSQQSWLREVSRESQCRRRLTPLSPREEQPCPETIKNQLSDKQGKWNARSCESTALLPYHPGRDSHQHVKCGPDGTEEPCWRRPRRPGELLVERRGIDGGSRSKARGDEGHDEPADKTRNGTQARFCHVPAGRKLCAEDFRSGWFSPELSPTERRRPGLRGIMDAAGRDSHSLAP